MKATQDPSSVCSCSRSQACWSPGTSMRTQLPKASIRRGPQYRTGQLQPLRMTARGDKIQWLSRLPPKSYKISEIWPLGDNSIGRLRTFEAFESSLASTVSNSLPSTHVNQLWHFVSLDSRPDMQKLLLAWLTALHSQTCADTILTLALLVY